MLKRKKNIITVLFLMFSVFFIYGQRTSFSYFLMDDEEEEVKDVIKRKSTARSGLPPYIAYAIKAVPIPGMHGSIRITWKSDPDYKGKFVLARSKQIIDTVERALKATSVKLFKPERDNSYIDPNLVSGNYFYAVIAQEKIARKHIELYRDVNYTSLPVLIESKKMRDGNHITNLRAKAVSNTRVLLTWYGVSGNNIIYSIYRSRRVIDSESALAQSQRIQMLTNKEQHIDDSVPASETYYYAVLVTTGDRKEHQVFIAEQTYTTQGVYVNTNQQLPIINIRAGTGGRGILLKWSTVNKTMLPNIEGFAIYRSNVIIDSQKRLNSATHLGTIDNTQLEYLDTSAYKGRNYYAVLVKYKNGLVDFRLKKDYNYTSQPALPGHKRRNRREYKRTGPVETGTVDEIIKRTFFQGYYTQAVKELQQILDGSDNYAETAKARLFIGRSYIELHRYNEAVQYLLHSDVQKYFPVEASFWRDYATVRMK